jgi:hypothetical protein
MPQKGNNWIIPLLLALAISAGAVWYYFFRLKPPLESSLPLTNNISQPEITKIEPKIPEINIKPILGRSLSLAQIQAGDYEEGDLFTVTASQYGEKDDPYLWYNSPIDAPMKFSGGSWSLNLPYNKSSSTPALEYTAKTWLQRQKIGG